MLPEAKGWVSWLDPDTLLLSSAWGGDARRRAMRERCGCGCGMRRKPGLVRGAAKACRPAGASTAAHLEARVVRRSCRLLRRQSLDGDGEGGNRSTCLPTDIEILTTLRWMAIKPRKAWTVAGKIRATTPCSASGWIRSGRRPDCSSCRPERRRRRCRASSGAPTGSSCRSSTTCSRCSLSSHRPTKPGDKA